MVELEKELDKIDVSSEIKQLMLDYDQVTGELKDTSPLNSQPASATMAQLCLERESALLKVCSESAQDRMDAVKLENSCKERMANLNTEIYRWLRKEPGTIDKLE